MVLQDIYDNLVGSNPNDFESSSASIIQGKTVNNTRENNENAAEGHMSLLQQTGVPKVSYLVGMEGVNSGSSSLNPATHVQDDVEAFAGNNTDSVEGNNPKAPDSDHQATCSTLSKSIDNDLDKLNEAAMKYNTILEKYKKHMEEKSNEKADSTYFNTVLVNRGSGIEIHSYDEDVVSYVNRLADDKPDEACAKLIGDYNISQNSWGDASKLQPIKDLFNNKCRDPNTSKIITKTKDNDWPTIPDPTGKQNVTVNQNNADECPLDFPIHSKTTSFCCASTNFVDGDCIGEKKPSGDGVNNSRSITVKGKKFSLKSWGGFAVGTSIGGQWRSPFIYLGVNKAFKGNYNIVWAEVPRSEKNNYSQKDAPPGYVYMKDVYQSRLWGKRPDVPYTDEKWIPSVYWGATKYSGFFYLSGDVKSSITKELENYIAEIYESPSPKVILTNEKISLRFNPKWVSGGFASGLIAKPTDGICKSQLGAYFGKEGNNVNWQSPTDDNGDKTGPLATGSVQSYLGPGGERCNWTCITGCPGWGNYVVKNQGKNKRNCSLNQCNRSEYVPPIAFTMDLLNNMRNFHKSLYPHGSLNERQLKVLKDMEGDSFTSNCQEIVDKYGLFIKNDKIIAGCINPEIDDIVKTQCLNSSQGWLTPNPNSNMYRTGCDKRKTNKQCPPKYPYAYDGNRRPNSYCCTVRGVPSGLFGSWNDKCEGSFKKCPHEGQCSDNSLVTTKFSRSIAKNNIKTVKYFPERTYINKFGYTQSLDDVTNSNLTGKLNEGINKILSRCQSKNKSGQYIDKEDGCFTDIPTNDMISESVKQVDSIFSNCSEGGGKNIVARRSLNESDYNDVANKNVGNPLSMSKDENCVGPVINKSGQNIAGTIIYYDGGEDGRKGYYWVDTSGYATYIGPNASIFNNKSTARRCMPYLGVTNQTIGDNTLSQYIEANKNSISVNKLPPVSPEKVNLKAIMCSSYNRSIYLKVQEAGEELAKQMRVVNNKINNARSCANYRGSKLIETEKDLAKLVDQVNSDMDDLEHIRLREKTNIGQEETSRLVKDSYKSQFIVWSIIAVILLLYGIFGVSTSVNFRSPIHIAMMVACVVIIFIILRRVYLSGII